MPPLTEHDIDYEVILQSLLNDPDLAWTGVLKQTQLGKVVPLVVLDMIKTSLPKGLPLTASVRVNHFLIQHGTIPVDLDTIIKFGKWPLTIADTFAVGGTLRNSQYDGTLEVAAFSVSAKDKNRSSIASPEQISEISRLAERHLNSSMLTVISDKLKPPPTFQLASAHVLLEHRQATVSLQLIERSYR